MYVNEDDGGGSEEEKNIKINNKIIPLPDFLSSHAVGSISFS